jgi:hypothetical protein
MFSGTLQEIAAGLSWPVNSVGISVSHGTKCGTKTSAPFNGQPVLTWSARLDLQAPDVGDPSLPVTWVSLVVEADASAAHESRLVCEIPSWDLGASYWR